MGEGEIAKLLNGENPGNVVNGKLTYGWSTKYTLENKDYASKSFEVDLAQDYYCTLASYISADNTLVRGDGETLAWRGFEVGLPPVNDTAVSDTGLWSREIGIPVGQSYESHDATLCLTNTATADGSNIARSVIITGNKERNSRRRYCLQWRDQVRKVRQRRQNHREPLHDLSDEEDR